MKHLFIRSFFAFLLLLSACAGPNEIRNRHQAIKGWSKEREDVRVLRRGAWNRATGQPSDEGPVLGQFGVNPGVSYASPAPF